MVATIKHSTIESGGDVLRQSSRGLGAHTRDIMDRGYANAPAPDLGSLFNSGSMEANPGVYDPFSGEHQQTFTQSLIQGNTRTETLMETMNPGKSYAGPKVNAGGMMRDAGKAVTDGAKVSRQANNAMDDTKKNIASFQQDWKQAKTEALDALKESAKDMDISPSAAVDALIPDTGATKAAAMVYIGAEMMLGGGSFATALGKGSFVSGQVLSDKDKNLSPEKQEALLEETVKRLQASSAGSNDTRANASGGGSVPLDAPKGSDVAWENMQSDDLAEFLAADTDGADQPEMKALLQLECDLEVVQENHGHVKQHYGDVVTSDKIAASVSAGNGAMNKLVADATVVAAPAYDAVDVMLSGDSVSGIVSGVDVSSSNPGFDSKSVETIMDWSKLDMPQIQRQLSADIGMQMNA